MSIEENTVNCQIPCLQLVAEGAAKGPVQSFSRRCKLMVRRHLSPGKERNLKNRANDYLNGLCKITGRSTRPPATASTIPSSNIKAGDLVRVRSREEIENTLNHWRQVKGCAFMAEMAEFCGTIQRAFKSMSRFVDERDLKIKKSKGIILLEGVMCKGTAEFGDCDRSCLHFWREEWLEKLEMEPDYGSRVSSSTKSTNGFVEIRPREAIEATLDRDRRYRGCTFLPEMAQYCRTTQRVLKSMNRFVDERNLKVKVAGGIVLLEGILCKGAGESSRCDRSCHLLWRTEWLEWGQVPAEPLSES